MDWEKTLKRCKENQIELVVIGVSAGGVDALMKLLPGFSKPSKISVAVVIHLPAEGANLMTKLFQDICSFEVKEAFSGEKIEKETIYFSPLNYHLAVEPDGHFSLSSDEEVNFSRPSVDVLFEEAALAMNKKVLGVILTGSNEDGAKGLLKIQQHGGITVIQDSADAAYPQMPLGALKLITPDLKIGLDKIKDFFEKLSECR